MARSGDGIYKRGNGWRLDFIYQGQRNVRGLGRNISKSVAKEIAAVKRAAILRGEAGIGRKKRKDISWEKAVEEFKAWVKPNIRPNTFRGYCQHLRELGQTFGARNLSEIHTFLIEKHRQRRITEAAVAFNRELGTLKTLFNYFIDREKFDGPNPTRKVKKIKESRGRERFLEIEEEDRLLSVCTEPLRTIVMSGIYGGLRIHSEALTLQKADVDLRRRLLTVQGAFAKNGETLTIPLNSKLREALRQRMLESESEYVFTKCDGKPYRSIQNIFRTACKRAGLVNVTPHVMRHTFASRLGMEGVDIRTIQELGRWKDIRMVQRYANFGKPVSLGSATGIRTLV
jgi:integrase